MERPKLNANEADILEYSRAWVKIAATSGFEAALDELDNNQEVAWSLELFEQLTFDHFDDGCQPKITDPDEVQDLKVEAFEYNDGTGFAVDHDLLLDGKYSDFTVQLDFRKGNSEYSVQLIDIHVL